MTRSAIFTTRPSDFDSSTFKLQQSQQLTLPDVDFNEVFDYDPPFHTLTEDQKSCQFVAALGSNALHIFNVTNRTWSMSFESLGRDK